MLNINGWTNENKLLRQEIIKAIDSDIICLIETHLKNNNKLDVDGYVWFGHNRPNIHVNAIRGSGGVGVLIKSSLFTVFNVKVIDKSLDGVLVLKLSLIESEFSVTLFCCYLPPETSVRGRDSMSFFAHLTSLIYLCMDSDLLLLCGDFNARIGDESDVILSVDTVPGRQCIDSVKNGHGTALLEFLHDMKLCTLNGRLNPNCDNYTSISTRGSAVVDYIVTTHDCFDSFKMFSVDCMNDLLALHNLFPLISERSRSPDHSVLNCVFECKAAWPTTQTQTVRNNNANNPINKKYLFNNVSADFMMNDLWKQNVSQMIESIEQMHVNQNDIDLYYDKFCKTLITEMDKYVNFKEISRPTRKRLKNTKPYWTNELTSLWKSMSDKERTFLKSKGTNRYRTILRNEYLLAQKVFDKALRKTERTYYRKQLERIEEVNTSNPREFWDHIKNLGPRSKTKIPDEVLINGTVSREPDDIKEFWKNEFSKLYNKQDSELGDQYNQFLREKTRLENLMSGPENLNTSNELNRKIEFIEIERIINKMKSNKATGIDLIPYEALKSPEVKLMCFNFFDKFFEHSLLPSSWLKAIITPVPKGADKDPRVPLNYRGISLMSCVCKVYTSLLNNRLTIYSESNGHISDEQNGFRSDRSCTDHQFVLFSILKNRLNSNKPTFLAFIDLKKAFDWIDRDLLLYKLLKNGINGKLYSSIKALYSNTMSCVRINNTFTEWFYVNSGVRQGDSLSTTLFNLYIDDIIDAIKQCNTGVTCGETNICSLLYADDLVLISENETGLQNMLNVLEDWTKCWQLNINCDKSKVMHIRKKRMPCSTYEFKLGNTIVETVKCYKYLGLVINEYCDFNFTVETLCNSAGRALGAVIARFKKFKDVGYKTFTKLYNSCVVPVIDYGSAVWGGRNFKHCDQIHCRAIRFYLGVHRFAPLAALKGDMGWPDPQTRQKTAMLKYWNRLVNMSDERITKKIFTWDHAIRLNNWSSQLAEIIQSVSSYDVFNSKLPVCMVNLSHSFLENTENEWKTNVSSKPKLRLYSKFKDNFKTDDYVLSLMPRYERSLLAQLRMGILPLRVETGRFVNESLNDRICTLCDLHDIEDEIHFVCRCTTTLNYSSPKLLLIETQIFAILLNLINFYT